MNTSVSVQPGGLPTWALAVLGAMVAVQLALQIIAFVNLARTPVERVVFGRKWPWVLIILLGELVGSIVYLAAGRRPAEAADPNRASTAAASSSDRASRAVDLLYGEDERR